MLSRIHCIFPRSSAHRFRTIAWVSLWTAILDRSMTYWLNRVFLRQRHFSRWLYPKQANIFHWRLSHFPMHRIHHFSTAFHPHRVIEQIQRRLMLPMDGARKTIELKTNPARADWNSCYLSVIRDSNYANITFHTNPFVFLCEFSPCKFDKTEMR